MSSKKSDVTKAIGDYKFNAKMSKTNRIADFLDWAARNYPRQFVPLNLVVKAIQGYSRTPQINSREVETTKAAMGRVNGILQGQYERSLYSVSGLGVRATVDSGDAAQTVMPKKSSRLKAAKNSFLATANLIDPAKIPDTPEMRPWKQWIKVSVRDIVKTISAPDFEQRLLAPRSDSDK